jgi:phage host-nuclease inhibitor protein Gam
MTKRISKKVIAGIDMVQFEESLSQYAGAEARTAEITRVLENEMKLIKNKYADELQYLEEKKKQNIEVVETFCKEQKIKLFNKQRTLHTVYGSVGFRLGNPKLKMRRGNSWTLVIEALKDKLPQYVRVTEEPAKDLLIADRHSEPVATTLQAIGLQIVQDEIFFVELKPLISKLIQQNVKN